MVIESKLDQWWTARPNWSSFSKINFKQEAFRNTGFPFDFRRRWRHDDRVISLPETDLDFLKHKSKMAGDCDVFIFLRGGVDGAA